VFRVASQDWRQQEQALLQIGRVVVPWMMLDYRYASVSRSLLIAI
jgi:hypothetical protein